LPNPNHWQVTPETARPLQDWQHHLGDVKRAKIVITNYHAFKLRERIELSQGGRQLLQGRTGEEPKTLETEGRMLQRVMPDLMGITNILVINDEGHHGEDLTGDARQEAEKNTSRQPSPRRPLAARKPFNFAQRRQRDAAKDVGETPLVYATQSRRAGPWASAAERPNTHTQRRSSFVISITAGADGWDEQTTRTHAGKR